jgi:predicted enzyme related to lactoylglutathione lyase
MERLKLGEFTWTDYQATDRAKQSPFYEELFGWTFEDMPTGEGRPDYRMYYKDGVVVAACNQMSPDMAASGMPPFWALYMATPDVDGTAAKAVELGGTIIMPAMDVLDSGRMVGIADPTGGSFFLWQKNTFAGSGAFMGDGAISWADLNTRDVEGSIAFYSGLFGYDIQKLEQGPTPYWQISVDGTGEGGMMAMPEGMPPEMPPFWLVYFGVPEIGAGVAKVRELGGSVMLEPTDIGQDMFFAVCGDPAGAGFALLGPKKG